MLLQDGLRLYIDGDVSKPLPDAIEDEEDSGNKGVSFKSEPLLVDRATLLNLSAEFAVGRVARRARQLTANYLVSGARRVAARPFHLPHAARRSSTRA
jgi:hypothetical protein